MAALLLLLLAACAPTYNVRTSSDPVLGTTRNAATGNILAGACLGCGSFELNVIQLTGNRTTYALSLDYVHSDWFFIEGGHSLSLRIDGELVRLNTEGPPSRRVFSGYVRESAIYRVDAAFVKRLATAGQVDVRIDGSRGYTNRSFTPENTAFFERFVTEFMD